MKKVLSILAVLMLIAAAIPVIAAAGTDPIVGTWEADAEGAIQYMAEYYGLDASFIRSDVGADYSVTYVFCEDGTYSMESMSNGSLLQTSGVYTGENGVYSITSTSTTHENGPGAVSICTLDDEDHMHIGSKESGVYTPYIRVSGGAPAAGGSFAGDPIIGTWEADTEGAIQYMAEYYGLDASLIRSAVGADYSVTYVFCEDGTYSMESMSNGSLLQTSGVFTGENGVYSITSTKTTHENGPGAVSICTLDDEDHMHIGSKESGVYTPYIRVSGDAPAAELSPVVGRWDASDFYCQNSGLNYEDVIAAIPDFAVVIEFTEDGKRITSVTANGSVTQLAENEYTVDGGTLTVDGDSCNWQLENDVLTLSLPGVTVIMPRLPDGPAGAQRPDAVIGTWDGAAILYSPFFDTQEEAEARFGEIAYLHVFRENGTLSVTTTMLGDTHTSDYSYTIDGDTLTIGNDVFSWKVEGDVLTFWNDEISNTLYRVEN